MNPATFDRIWDRHGTDCSKWDAVPYDNVPQDVIPMWVADMDFACPEAVLAPMRKRLEHPLFGYAQLPADYHDAIIHWQEKRYHSSVQASQIVPVSSVLSGVAMAVQAYTSEGDTVMVPTPGYHAFFDAITNNRRVMIPAPMKVGGDYYSLDLPLMDRLMSENSVKLLLFCSPHNPTGRLWTKEELCALVDLCQKRHVLIVSDEIHSDMTLGRPFTTIFGASDKAADIAVALYSPTKTFNIAGLCTAYAVIQSRPLLERFQAAILASGAKVKNTLGVCAMVGGYQEGEAWVDALQQYLLENERIAVDFLNRRVKGAHAYLPQATYFLWIDFSQSGLHGNEIMVKWIEHAHVAPHSGDLFIQGGETFVRMNVACPRQMLLTALERLEAAFSEV